MKKLFLLTVVSALSLTMQAQVDDMYFVPSKEKQAQEAKNFGLPKNTYYSGSQRSVDDYNRKMWTKIEPTDSTGNDIIDFSAVRGVYPDSVEAMSPSEDYQLTRKMSRFDDYTPTDAYWDGYRDGRMMSPWYFSYNSWYWNDPLYYRSWYWNDPWYYRSWYWNDPWYYSYYGSPWYYGYYSPWYSSLYYGYYVPHWYGGGRIYTSNSGRPVNHRPALHGNNFGGNRDRSVRTASNNSSRNVEPSSFGGYRSNSTFNNSSSFGGSRGSSFGGGGGGGIGGGRSASGGRSFGGRR